MYAEKRCASTKVQILPPEDLAAVVVGVKVHVESIYIAVALVVDDNSCGGGALSLAVGIGLCAFDPLGVLGHVVVGREPHVAGHLIQVQRCQGLGGPRDFLVVYARRRGVEEGLEIGGVVRVVRV